ncbi:hypothetical protein [Nocardia bovistercoris]|uniref:Uncharacterized protein n=1 Tax=Nocardia bovistercoris TaxID=2785916 RepID=A0A931N5M1_9NOCA|nr:hypothetical protein [Nocardia bovistercoris]MBH0778808.1 hypothetical protein [Nocardia bovistercoris]
MAVSPEVVALIRDLRRVPELFAQLDVTITRTDVTVRPGGGGGHGSGHDRPLILNDRASEARRRLLLVLRRAATLAPYAPTALSARDAATRVLHEVLPATLGQPWCREWVKTLSRALTAAWGAVDLPSERTFAGRCQECGTPVTTSGRLGVVECPECGSDHDARQHRDWMVEAAHDRTGTAVELARLLPEFEGAHVRADTIRKWHQRGLLFGCLEERGTTFRIGDVLALHRARRPVTRAVRLAA